MNSLLWVSGSSLETGCRAQPEELEEVILEFLWDAFPGLWSLSNQEETAG